MNELYIELAVARAAVATTTTAAAAAYAALGAGLPALALTGRKTRKGKDVYDLPAGCPARGYAILDGQIIHVYLADPGQAHKFAALSASPVVVWLKDYNSVIAASGGAPRAEARLDRDLLRAWVAAQALLRLAKAQERLAYRRWDTGAHATGSTPDERAEAVAAEAATSPATIEARVAALMGETP